MTPNAYYQLKAALALYGKEYTALQAAEQSRASDVALQYTSIEAVVLSSEEARGVCLAPEAVDKAIAEIRARHPGDESFAATLAHAGLTRTQLVEALQRDLLVDAVMARVGSAMGEVGQTEAEIFYYTHLDRFRVPEVRAARHILITVNEAYPENSATEAKRRLQQIEKRITLKPSRFEEQAIKHSECPTALNGGQLGDVRKGQLYPELDAALFQMKEGELSDILLSELGFHLLRCDAIQAGRTLPFAEVMDSLQSRLTEERAQKEAKRWLTDRLRQHRAALSS